MNRFPQAIPFSALTKDCLPSLDGFGIHNFGVFLGGIYSISLQDAF